MPATATKPQYANSPRPALPEDIIHRILGASRYLDVDSLFPPSHSLVTNPGNLNTYTNRYTRFALLTRRVCRLWRNIVDMRSSYWARVSAADLLLDISDDPKLNHTNYHDFRKAIQHVETSMLVLELYIDEYGGDDEYDDDDVNSTDSADTDENQRSDLYKFFHQASKLIPYKDRILQIDLQVPGGTFTQIPAQFIRAFGHNAAIRRLGVYDDSGLDSRIPFDDMDISPEMKFLTSNPDETCLEQMAVQLTYLEHLSFSAEIDLTELSVPAYVTQLELGTRLGHWFGFGELREFLGSVGPRLKVLRIRVSRGKELLPPDRQPILMPLLESLSIGDGPRMFANFMQELDCPKLEEATAEIWHFCNTPSTSDLLGPISRWSDEAHLGTRFPMLKKLEVISDTQYAYHKVDDSMLPLLAVPMPSLESLVFQLSAPDGSLLRPSFSVEAPSALQRLSALPIRSLTFQDTKAAASSLDFLGEFLNLEGIQHLWISESVCVGVDLPACEVLPCPGKVLSMPHLRYLGLTTKRRDDIAASVLNLLTIGDKFSTLELNTSSPSRLANKIEKYALENKLRRVTTLITKTLGTSQFLRFYPNLTTLVLKNYCGRIEEEIRMLALSVSRLDSATDSDATTPDFKKPLLPNLQHLTLESSERPNYGPNPHTSHLVIMEIIREVDACRLALGAVSLKSVTFAMEADFGQPEVEELPADTKDGIVFRFMIANKDQQPSALLAKI